MAPFNSVSVMPCVMLMCTPLFLMLMRIGASECAPTGRSSISSGACYSTHAWKNITERYMSSILFAHLRRYGGVNGAVGAAFSNVGGVGRYNTFLI